MKKILALILVICITNWSIIPAIGLEKDDTAHMNESKISLTISSDENDLKIMEKYNCGKIDNYSASDHKIEMFVTAGKEENDMVSLSGNGTVDICGKIYTFNFTNSNVCKAVVNGSTMYDGVVETQMISKENCNDIKDIYIDLISKSDFAKAIISLTVKDESDEMYLLYGTPFEEQIALVNNVCEEYKRIESLNDYNVENNQTNLDLTSTSTKSYLQHVTNKSNSVLAGVTRNKQMVVMSVGKYDPKNSGELNAMENIRVFSRSYNVDDFVEDGIQAIPFKVHATFSASKNTAGSAFLEITATEPNSSSNDMQRYFDIFSSIVSGVTQGQAIASIALIMSNFVSGSVTKSKNGQSYNSKVTFSHQVYKTTNINYSLSTNLPSSTGSSDAEENTGNGVNFTIHYIQRATNDASATATCSASVDYRVIVNESTRFVSVSSGTATISHTLNAKQA